MHVTPQWSTVVVGIAGFLGPVVPADELSAAQAKAMDATIARAEQMATSGHAMADEDVIHLDGILAGLKPDDWVHVRDRPKYKELSSASYRALTAGFRAVMYYRAYQSDLTAPAQAGRLLASDRSEEVSEGLLVIAKSARDGESLQRAIVKLSREERPELRMDSGALASAAWHIHGRSDPLVRVAENLLVDAEPRVALAFGAEYCYGFHDRELVTKMVQRFSDQRKVASEVRPEYSETVSQGLARSLGTELFVMKQWQHADSAKAEQMRKSVSQESVSAWWKANGKAWSFSPIGPDWQCLEDRVFDIAVGEKKQVGASELGLNLRLESIRCVATEGVPKVPFDLSIFEGTDEEEIIVINAGTPESRLGTVACSRSGSLALECVVLPIQDNRYKVRLWLWRKLSKPIVEK